MYIYNVLSKTSVITLKFYQVSVKITAILASEYEKAYIIKKYIFQLLQKHC